MVSAHHVSIYIHVGWGGVCAVFNFLTILRATGTLHTASCTSISLTGPLRRRRKVKRQKCPRAAIGKRMRRRRAAGVQPTQASWDLGAGTRRTRLAWEDCGFQFPRLKYEAKHTWKRATTRPSINGPTRKSNVQSSNANRQGSRRRRALGVYGPCRIRVRIRFGSQIYVKVLIDAESSTYYGSVNTSGRGDSGATPAWATPFCAGVPN